MFRPAQTGHDDPVDESPTGRSRPRNAALRPDPASAPPKTSRSGGSGTPARARRATKVAKVSAADEPTVSEVTVNETTAETATVERVPAQKALTPRADAAPEPAADAPAVRDEEKPLPDDRYLNRELS